MDDPSSPDQPMERALYEVKKIIVGQDLLLERLIVALLARGHILVEGVPGLAKTMAIKTLAGAIGGEFQRIQFTPDLVPADLVGTRIYNQRSGEFTTSLGPVFTNLLLADEINRAPAKVQSALLEVMQERQVTIGRETHPVPNPFLVMATQNPIETEGTYPLPEAQVDRFMLKVLVGYPTPTEEFVIVERMTNALDAVQKVIDNQQLLALQAATDAVYVDPALIEYAVRVVTATRDPKSAGIDGIADYLLFGASPRAAINLILAARALAFVRGRTYALPQDVYDLVYDVIRHRLVLSYEALADRVTADDVLRQVVTTVPLPVVPLHERNQTLGRNAARAPAPPEQLLERLDWHVVRRLDGLLQGDYRTLFYGAGLDFADLREYQPTDDIRHMDWNVTARMDTPYVRQYVDDRDLTAWLLLDRSPSMAFGQQDRPKELVLTELVATIARLVTRNGNRVGAVLYDNTVQQVIEPRTGRNQVLRIARELLRDPARTGTATDLGGLFEAGLGCIKRRSLVFVISDFISESGWERPLTLLARKHEVIAIRLLDPREVELPDAGIIVMQDAETGEQLYVDTGDPRFRQRFAAAAVAREQRIQASAKRSGVDLHTLSTDEDLVRALVRMVELRKRRRH